MSIGLIRAIIFGTAVLGVLNSNPAKGQNAAASEPDSYTANDRPPDPRLKADILVVVAHPDDETLVDAYLAREVYDEHKRVAVVFGTHGEGSINEVGPEQAMAMGNIREMEGRQAVGYLGITNVWFLTGRDTLSQNVLNSLGHWGHGSCLEQLVRIVRMTRPSVILTFLPDFTTGENHADHQAAGVLATEAFDLAGDLSAFSEQISPASNPDKNMSLTEGLRPWQPEKIYYFYNPTHDIFAGQGPQYSSKEISPSHRLSYGRIAVEMYAHHRTQGGDHLTRAIESNTVENSQDPYVQLATEDMKLIFGKSLVPSGVTDDVFAGVVPGGIPFQPAPGFTPVLASSPSVRIGDPWNYYHIFWQAHGLDHLASIVPTEVTVKVGGILAIPLIIENPLETAISVELSVQAPEGWKVEPAHAVSIAPHTRYLQRIQATAPETKVPGWQNFIVSAQSDSQNIGTVPVRVELSTGWVAPQ
jgi:LmbE family N-acetylglucosaminyl deacetylase